MRKEQPVFVRNRCGAPSREWDGLVSRMMLGKGDVPGGALTVTWVEVGPGASQRPHDHGPEQVYVVVRGSGRMRVGDEEREVTVGDLVYVPPGATHGIENPSDGPLTYISAATPNLDWQAFYDAGALRTEERGTGGR